jgi:hypothetical protein
LTNLVFRELWNELGSKLSSTGVSSSAPNQIQLSKTPLAALDRAKYPKVKYWTEKAYSKARESTCGDTDGFAREKKLRGRPRKSSESDDDDDASDACPWLETEDGMPITKDRLADIRKKLWRLLGSLLTGKIAPDTWGNASELAYQFVHLEMSHAFIEFCLCDGGWKLEKLITLKYPGWSRPRKEQILKALDLATDTGSNKRKRLTSADTHGNAKKSRHGDADQPIEVEDTSHDSVMPIEDTRNESVTPIEDARDESAAPIEDAREESVMPIDDTRDESVMPIDDTRNESVMPIEDAHQDSVLAGLVTEPAVRGPL